MTLFEVSASLLTACAIGSYINYKWIKLPSSISLLLLAMIFGLIGLLLRKLGLISNYYITDFLNSVNFKETVFHGMLSFLLFAGALQINLEDLKTAKIPVAITATISTLISTFIVGFTFYAIANLLGFTQVNLLYALLFGAILSPTDPVAVRSIIKKMQVSKKLETIIIGESLFNDGVAIVFFLSILELLKVGGETGIVDVIKLLLLEVGGGILFGGLLGWIAYQMLLKIDAYQVELFITLAVTTGGYVLADKLNFSAPLTMVIAGLIIGNHGRAHAMSDKTKKYIYSFWEAIDEILNAVLFFLIGLEMIVISPTFTIALLGLSCIPIAIVARFISIAIPLTMVKRFYSSMRGIIIILTWGGLRGALSIAMVLSLEAPGIKEIFLPCIYFVVTFSIIVQGLTLKNILKKYKMD